MAASCVGDTLNQAWKNDKSKFGLKMLQKMGWTEGKGLGKNEDGVCEHVKVSKKSNNLGLGATRDQTGAAGWASTAVSFNGVLEALGKAYGTNANKDSAKKKDKKASTKMGGSRKAKGSKRRKGETDDKKDSTSDGKAGSDDSNSDGGAEDGVAVSNGGVQGAFACPSRARRVRSKDVKSFSTADLRAILGQSAGPSLPSYPAIGALSPTSAGSNTREKEKKTKSAKQKKRRRDESDGSGDGPDGVETAGSPVPRTRSVGRTEPSTAAESSPRSGGGHRPRTRSMDHAEGDADIAGDNDLTGENCRLKKIRKKDRGGAKPVDDLGSAEGVHANGEVLELEVSIKKSKKKAKSPGVGDGSSGKAKEKMDKKRRKKASKA